MDKIDTHVHLLYPKRFGYGWTASVPLLQKPFPLEDYWRAVEGCGVAGALFMEVDVDAGRAAGEAFYFCKMAEDPRNGLRGVVASAFPENDGFTRHLDTIAHPMLKGLRRVLHTQADELSTSAHFRRNVAALADQGLTFDLCVLARQLPLAIELVDACPQTRFILDHCGVPDIAGGGFEDWAKNLRELARREQMTCKISGLPSYCSPGQAASEQMRPYVETVLEAFGWDRVVWGGDWPVCTLNSSLGDWCVALDDILKNESPANLAKLYSLNANRIYNLQAS